MANTAAAITSLTAIYEDLSGKTAAQKAAEVVGVWDAFVKSGTVNTIVNTTVTTPDTINGTGTGTGTGPWS